MRRSTDLKATHASINMFELAMTKKSYKQRTRVHTNYKNLLAFHGHQLAIPNQTNTKKKWKELD